MASITALDANVVLDKSNAEWQGNMTTGMRHYLYPIHLSQAFVFSPSLASALYMLLFKFMSRQYDFAFRFVSSCVSDTDLLPEEAQIFNMLAAVNVDFHPDAHAVRLKMSLATMASSMACPWDPALQLECYVRKCRAVSAACRLTPEEELGLLEQYAQESRNPLLFNRLNYLRVLVHAGPNTHGAKVPVTAAPRPRAPCFDTYVDQTCTYVDVKGGGSAVGSFLTSMAYSRPESMVGAPVLEHLHKWIASGLQASGSGFLVYYEMMTGTLDLKIRPTDSAYTLASLLLHLLPPAEALRQQYQLSVLRVLINNPEQAAQAPKLEGRSKKTLDMMKNANIMKNFAKQVYAFFTANKAQFRWPQPLPEYACPELLEPPPLAELQKVDRIWTVPRVVDFSCEKRVLRPVLLDPAVPGLAGLALSAADIRAFASHPLASIGLGTFCTTQARHERGLPLVQGQIPFVVHHHPAARSHIAQSNLRRIQEDVAFYAGRENQAQTPILKCFFDSDLAGYRGNPQGPELQAGVRQLEALHAALKQLQARDSDYMFRAIDFLLNVSNGSGYQTRGLSEAEISKRLGHKLGQQGGREVTFWFELIIGFLCSPTGTQDMCLLNPYIQDPAMIENLTAGILLTVNRLAQVRPKQARSSPAPPPCRLGPNPPHTHTNHHPTNSPHHHTTTPTPPPHR